MFIRVALNLTNRTLYLQQLIEIPYRAFPERVGPRILLLESVNYFGATDHFRAWSTALSTALETAEAIDLDS